MDDESTVGCVTLCRRKARTGWLVPEIISDWKQLIMFLDPRMSLTVDAVINVLAMDTDAVVSAADHTRDGQNIHLLKHLAEVFSSNMALIVPAFTLNGERLTITLCPSIGIKSPLPPSDEEATYDSIEQGGEDLYIILFLELKRGTLYQEETAVELVVNTGSPTMHTAVALTLLKRKLDELKFPIRNSDDKIFAFADVYRTFGKLPFLNTEG